MNHELLTREETILYEILTTHPCIVSIFKWIKMIIKVCGMRDAKNIAAVSALDVDMLGFIFHPQSKRYVAAIPRLPETPISTQKEKKPLSTEPIASTASTVKRRPKRVGVFVDDMAQNIITRVYTFGLDYIQLHGHESPTMIRNLRATLIPDIQPPSPLTLHPPLALSSRALFF